MTNTVDQDRRLQTICLLILAAVATGMALYFLRPVLIPFVLAVFLVRCLKPFIDVQTTHLRMNQFPAVISTILLGCVLLALLWLLVGASVDQLRDNAAQYEQKFDQLTNDVIEWLPVEQLGLGDGQLDDYLGENVTVGSLLRRIAGGITSVLSNGLLVVVFMIFMLASGRSEPPPPGSLREQIESRVNRYIITKVIVSAVTGLLVGLTMWVLGVQLALVFGVLAFLLNFIPSIGSVIATVLPIPVVLVSPELSTVAKVLAIAIPGTVQFAVGNLIEPKILGGSLDLHPVMVLLGLIFFGMIWGIVGMFLATPLVAVVKIILDRVPITAPIGEALAGRLDRPPPPPPYPPPPPT